MFILIIQYPQLFVLYQISTILECYEIVCTKLLNTYTIIKYKIIKGNNYQITIRFIIFFRFL